MSSEAIIKDLSRRLHTTLQQIMELEEQQNKLEIKASKLRAKLREQRKLEKQSQTPKKIVFERIELKRKLFYLITL